VAGLFGLVFSLGLRHGASLSMAGQGRARGLGHHQSSRWCGQIERPDTRQQYHREADVGEAKLRRGAVEQAERQMTDGHRGKNREGKTYGQGDGTRSLAHYPRCQLADTNG